MRNNELRIFELEHELKNRQDWEKPPINGFDFRGKMIKIELKIRRKLLRKNLVC